MAKVLIATEKPFAPAAVAGIKAEIEGAGNQLALLEKYTEKAQLLAAVADADAIIIRSDKVDAEVLDAAKQLKIVVRAGAGYDNVDLEAATAHNQNHRTLYIVFFFSNVSQDPNTCSTKRTTTTTNQNHHNHQEQTPHTTRTT